MQPAGFAEGAAGFAGVADERGDRIAAREYAADDLAADAAGGADHCVEALPTILPVPGLGRAGRARDDCYRL